jgi:ubiquinone/menaquinone biosynthesis C-methylase UbiE
MEDQYNETARWYSLLLKDPHGMGEHLVRRLSELLDLEPAGRTILDCACGTGIELAHLAGLGSVVTGSDISEAMLAEARSRFDSMGLTIPLIQSEWKELPSKISERFDLVMCTGNSISHCVDRSEMNLSVRGMAEMLEKEGALVVAVRNWERIVEENPRFWVLESRPYKNKRVTPVYVWNLNGMSRKATIELLFVVDEGGETSFETHTISLRPFPREELVEAFRAANLVETQVIPERDDDWYWLTGKRE